MNLIIKLIIIDNIIKSYTFIIQTKKFIMSNIKNQKVDNDLVKRLRKLIDVWESKTFNLDRSFKDYLRYTSSGMKICIEDMAKEINY